MTTTYRFSWAATACLYVLAGACAQPEQLERIEYECKTEQALPVAEGATVFINRTLVEVEHTAAGEARSVRLTAWIFRSQLFSLSKQSAEIEIPTKTLLELPALDDIEVVFDATGAFVRSLGSELTAEADAREILESAGVHDLRNYRMVRLAGKQWPTTGSD